MASFELELEDGLVLKPREQPTRAPSPAPAPSSSTAPTTPEPAPACDFELDDAVSLVPLAQPRRSKTLPVGATTFGGERVYFPRKAARTYASMSKRELEQQDRERNEATARLAVSMLDRPMHRMLENIEAERVRHRDEAERRSRAENFEHAELPDKKAPLPASVKGKARESMWTDLYKPRTFTELLGDDRVHRGAMAWLKEWDACVFKPTTATAIAAARKKAAVRKRTRDGSKPADGDAEATTDPYGRPLEKVLLLCGPPGLGKTTLAHVLATQAGYAVAEINASDDRTAKVVTERIRDSLETRSIAADGTISGNQPTCVVIDEIDGASGGEAGGFVRALVKLVQDGSGVKKSRGRSKKPEARPLLRPIICICNDLYAPVLRPLRPLARIVRFSAPTGPMLVRRLRDICTAERLEVDSKNLAKLVDMTDGDLRSCLNTLQFIKTKAGRVDEAALKSASVGAKDGGTSLGAVWDRLFRIPHDRKGAPTGHDDGRYVARMVKDVQTCGEYDKLEQGCFEHYLAVRPPPDTFRAINRALDWVHAFDRFQHGIQRHQTYELLAYVPYTIVPWFPLFAHVANRKLDWPKADYEAYLSRQAHQEIADTFHRGLPISLSPLFTASSVVAELAPLMVRILSPDLRPVNSQLVRAGERATLAKLMHIMTTLGLSFVLDKAEDGKLAYKLEPPIDVFVHYEGKRSADIAPSRFGVRSIVAKEMEAEAIRKADSASANADAVTSTSATELMSAYRQTAGGQIGKEAAALDFFGRTIAKPVEPAVAAAEDSSAGDDARAADRPAKRMRIAYKYNEGVSTAVKLPIRIASLFASSSSSA